MSEPTRQEIKEEFKKTIERWEKIVEDVDYFKGSSCSLCTLENIEGDFYQRCNDSCPIVNFNEEDHSTCFNTPYTRFYATRKREDALAELNFLRKVYIWWMEKEKKEEWVDVVEELTAKVYERVDGFAINLYHNDLNIAFIDGDGIYIRTESGAYAIYKVEIKDETFRILRKT